eukprot:scaffold27387_cov63-Phaeocystis_antarctica.AAC.2
MFEHALDILARLARLCVGGVAVTIMKRVAERAAAPSSKRRSRMPNLLRRWLGMRRCWPHRLWRGPRSIGQARHTAGRRARPPTAKALAKAAAMRGDERRRREARRGAAAALSDRRSYLKEDSLCSGL